MDPAAPSGVRTDGPAVNGSVSEASNGSGDKDLTLVRRAQDGDRQAFRQLFDRYHRRAFAVAMGVVKNPEDAQDVVQEAFVKVHRHLGNFQGNSSFYTWLYRITMNLAIDHTRRRKNAKNVDFDDAIKHGEEVEDPGNLRPSLTGADPSQGVERKEIAKQIQAALSTLPEYHQQVILLRELEGRSYEEIAKIMKIPKGTVMSRLFHARRKMQEVLKDYLAGDKPPAGDK